MWYTVIVQGSSLFSIQFRYVKQWMETFFRIWVFFCEAIMIFCPQNRNGARELSRISPMRFKRKTLSICGNIPFLYNRMLSLHTLGTTGINLRRI